MNARQRSPKPSRSQKWVHTTFLLLLNSIPTMPRHRTPAPGVSTLALLLCIVCARSVRAKTCTPGFYSSHITVRPNTLIDSFLSEILPVSSSQADRQEFTDSASCRACPSGKFTQASNLPYVSALGQGCRTGELVTDNQSNAWVTGVMLTNTKDQ